MVFHQHDKVLWHTTPERRAAGKQCDQLFASAVESLEGLAIDPAKKDAIRLSIELEQGALASGIKGQLIDPLMYLKGFEKRIAEPNEPEFAVLMRPVFDALKPVCESLDTKEGALHRLYRTTAAAFYKQRNAIELNQTYTREVISEVLGRLIAAEDELVIELKKHNLGGMQILILKHERDVANIADGESKQISTPTESLYKNALKAALEEVSPALAAILPSGKARGKKEET